MNKKLEQGIEAELWRVRNRIKASDDSEVLVWVIPNALACSQRPLRDHPQFGGRRPLAGDAKPLVIRWVDRVEHAGITSIICLLENAQLERYYGSNMGLHENGLLGYYRSRRFHVRHYPLTDYNRPSIKDMEEVLRCFDDLPKPVLLHCSAAIDRTAPLAAFIAEQRGN
jgi:hypothetical protein